jgi:RNA polymerase sigma-B factor
VTAGLRPAEFAGDVWRSSSPNTPTDLAAAVALLCEEQIERCHPLNSSISALTVTALTGDVCFARTASKREAMSPVLDTSRDAGSPARYADAALLARYARDRDPADRERIFERFHPLALHLSRRYQAAGERQDLEQVAALALLKAIDRYDPRRGVAFSTFAVPTIVGEIKRYFRDLGWSVHVPRSAQELAQRLPGASEELTRERGRAPTVAELAAYCDTTVEAIVEARGLATAHRADSLDVPCAGEDGRTPRGELIPVYDDGFARAEHRVDLERLLADLPQRDREIVRLRFLCDLTQSQIADRIGISQMHVSRILRAAIAELEARAHALSAIA